MDKEREAFDKWYGIKPKGWIEAVRYNTAWKAWKAAKANEAEKLKGKVVVPVEPTHAMIDAGRYRQWDELSSPYECMYTLIYKAMIEAQEPAND